MMTEATSLPVAAIMFKWQKDGKTYDYFIPEEMTVNVVVATARGETNVEVMEIKTESDTAQKKILRVVQPETTEGEGA
ncbi:hypothetical protein ACC696_16430 [Rhizobium ruizarguesonis]